MPQDQQLNAALALVRSQVPSFGWVWKSDKWYHRAIGWIFDRLGMTGYLDYFYTTFRYTVGRPNDAKEGKVQNEFEVFVHEGQHAIDSKRLTFPFFALIYGFPQILALLAIPLAIILVLSTGSWLGLLGLLLLALAAPLPSPGRVWAELRGYRVSLSCLYWYGGIAPDLEQAYIEEFLSYFVNSSYYFMGYFFKSYIQKRLQFFLDELKAGRGYQGDAYLTAVRDLCLSFAKPD
jgi:hypothetical protein